MPSNTTAAFPKRERLCSQRLSDTLFSQGHRLMVFPFSVRWMLCPAGMLPDGVSVQVLIATSKRKFRHAVDRNRVKRLTRECYRRQKGLLVEPLAASGRAMLLAVNYVHNGILPYAALYGKMEKLLAVLAKEVEK